MRPTWREPRTSQTAIGTAARAVARCSGLIVMIGLGVFACTKKKVDSAANGERPLEVATVPTQVEVPEPVLVSDDDERPGDGMPPLPVPDRHGEMEPHTLDFDGRKAVGRTNRRHTHAEHGFGPIEDRLPAERIEVSTIEELVSALGSDRTIVLAPTSYVWRDDDVLGYHDKTQIESYDHLSEHYSKGVIHDVENLAIVGLGQGARILQPDSYANVLTFLDVRGLTLYNLVLGHHVDKGWCAGGVVRIDGGRNVVLDGLDMFGSGTEGVTLVNAEDVEIRHSIVWGCTEQLSSIGNAKNVRFVHTDFRDNDLLRGFYLYRAEVSFEDVLIANNRGGGSTEQYGSLFTIDQYVAAILSIATLRPSKTEVAIPDASHVKLRRSVVEDNTFARLTNDAQKLDRTATRMQRNRFLEDG